MEAFGVAASRPITSIVGGTGVEAQPHNASLTRIFCNAAGGTQRNLRASCKSLTISGRWDFLFSDRTYLDYYSSGRKIRCGACKEKVKEGKQIKKRLKMLRGLSRDLAELSEMGCVPNNVLVDPVEAKTISDAAELLQVQLQQLWSEEKELKQRMKEEKSRQKAAQMQKRLELEMSSSSSESSDSDSDCGEVIDMNTLNCKRRAKQIPDDASRPVPQNETLALPGHSTPQEGNLNDSEASIPKVKLVSESSGAYQRNCAVNSGASGTSNSSGDPAAKKIEVCMGGKCKKSGATMLMDEFQRVVGIEGAVSGCKCMGKCRDGPNVRISNKFEEAMQDPHLCIGVGLDDVGLIVGNFLRGSPKKFDLPAAS